MDTPISFDQVAALVALLPQKDRLRLVERIVRDLAVPLTDDPDVQAVDWMSLRGIAPNLWGNEDAQAWVTRTRQESDEHRELQLRRKP